MSTNASSSASSPVLSSQVIVAEGAGKAYQSVAQSMAIAIQDATDAMRNSFTIGNTAIGVALAQFLATKNSEYLQAIEPAQNMMTQSTHTWNSVGTQAATILKGFPSGQS